VDVVAAGLPDLTRLLCALHPEAERALARLVQDPFDASRTLERAHERRCHEGR
jgi:hypothetical protein